MKTLIIALLLSGCASNQAMLEFAEVPDRYKEPLTSDKYVYLIHGFYVDRNDFEDKDGKIKFRAVWDVRQLRKSILDEYDIKPEFNKKIPAFIEQKGETDCGYTDYTITKLSEKMVKISSKKGVDKSEAAEQLCMLRKIYSSRKTD